MNTRDVNSRLEQLRMPPGAGRPIMDPTFLRRPSSGTNKRFEDSPELRIRVEPNTRDAINARILESDPYRASRVTTSADVTRSPQYMDMNPIDSRRSVNSYKQAEQYFPDSQRQTGVANNQMPQYKRDFSENVFLQRLDPVNEPRQIMRELRSAVVEDNRDRDLDISQKILNRNFLHQWVPAKEMEGQNLNTLQAYELLKPRTDNFATNYRS